MMQAFLICVVLTNFVLTRLVFSLNYEASFLTPAAVEGKYFFSGSSVEHDFSPHFEKHYEYSLHCRTRPDVEPTPVYPIGLMWTLRIEIQ